MDKILLVTHSASGATIRILPYGATLLSYNTTGRSGDDSGEVLFVSESAILDGSKPVRGGIPLVFPVFGPHESLPQHGFARRNEWQCTATHDNAESAGVVFALSLKDVRDGRGAGNAWANEAGKDSYDCSLQYTVEFNATQLTTELEILNTGTVAFPFQALLHTYYKVAGSAALQSDQCFVKGLEGYLLVDKVTKSSDEIINNDIVTISSEVDRVYHPPAANQSSLTTSNVTVQIGVGNGKSLHMEASGTINGSETPISCVVWNPHSVKAREMSDFGDEEYHDMICVEPGMLLKDQLPLAPGQRALLKQVIRV
jgi:glucose-6-phosphate 1-epimerase